MRTFWNGLTPEEWREELEKQMTDFLEGRQMIKLPEKYFQIRMDFGVFIEVQSSCMLKNPPEVLVRTCHYGPALKILIPKEAKEGDDIRVVCRSKSGKSYVAEIVTERKEETER